MAEKNCTNKQTDKPTDTTKIMVTWLWTKNFIDNEMYWFGIFHHRLHATVNLLWPGPSKIWTIDATVSCANNDAMFTFLLIWCFSQRAEFYYNFKGKINVTVQDSYQRNSSQAVVSFVTWLTAGSTKGNSFPVLATWLSNLHSVECSRKKTATLFFGHNFC